MIVVRNVFRLKFGKAKEAIAAMQEADAIGQRLAGKTMSSRILTDITGDFYTLVLELTSPDMATSEQHSKQIMSDPQWGAVYQKFVPLVESGHREIFNVVETPTTARA